ncbi:Omp28-related outer membrane protein [Hymenobacter rubidus]|uniref:Omp28-related outer membrane protein n=1 Tax=Hymenobacter rubidus TaxID=1441626 RepID=UPI00191D727A|nr:Omp28-related outer membrane protein [Hymenobacter rubidus]
MNNITLIWMRSASLVVLGSMAALSACDVIDNPQPAKITSSLTPIQQARLDSADAKHPAPALTQHVLIEDLTGQYCGNCPRAASMADSLRLRYPGRVLVTEEHVTDYFAAPRLPHFPIDFRVPVVSQELDKTYDLSNRGLPQGAVNRSPFVAANNDPVATFSLWPGVVTAQLAQTPTVELRATPLFNRSSRLLTLKVATKYLTARPGRSMRLGIMVVEDSVVGAQKDYRLNRVQFPDQTVDTYVHHNVLRAALAGTFGTQQVVAPTAGQQFGDYVGYQMPAASVWNDRKCSVIVYIADADTRQIVQAVQAKFL